ncbi:polysaccharide deacetylase family protein [Streptomyces reticuliscabiei]|uniref:polysaccharide deacetylase family protein n=1 Tax=Streptomyces reticuliscabiei TaxID=146821 RepID=UPI000A36940C|nr:polysaccharide deacetylase family protein [Streptomyces reticuliscabiei]
MFRAGTVVLAMAALASGCTEGTAPPKSSRPAPGQELRLHAPPARALDAYAQKLRRSHAARLAAARRWGLGAPPLTAPAPPTRKPRLTTRKGFEVDDHEERGLPPVFTTIPTRDKVVFLTIDDGAERDPRFVALVRELRLPVSMFLTARVVGPGYAHFARLREVGASVQNHTLDHQSLRGLPYAGQRAEICGQQDKLRERFGLRPRLFRPPYGTYDTTTLRAASDCGASALVLWTPGEKPLGPGTIALVGPDDDLTGPPLVERTLQLLRELQRRGLSVGRLEDYL